MIIVAAIVCKIQTYLNIELNAIVNIGNADHRRRRGRGRER